jgi:hypothetical protein
MSRAWTLLSLSALVVLGGWLLVAGPAQPSPAFAADCSPEDTGTLVIQILDLQTDDLLDVGGSVVLIDPDPTDFELDKLVTDSDITDAGGLQDQDNESGVIRWEGACSTIGGEAYSAIYYSVPSGLEEVCEIADSSDVAQLDAGETAVLELSVECIDLTPTATPGATSTPGPTAVAGAAANVLVSASDTSVSCGGSSVIAVLVLDSAGDAVEPGTPVTVSTNLGVLSPGSGHATDENGFLSLTFVAPVTGGGTATITAAAGSASDSAQVAVNCISDVLSGAPQASTGGSIIRPPSTGDGGLAAHGP